MTIASLAPADRDAAVALWHACGLTRPWNDAGADFDRALAAPHAAVLGARDEGEALIGTVMVGEDGHRGWLYYLGVDPAARRRGTARALTGAAEAWLAARGVPKVQLMVRHDNADAATFYAALGYEEAEVTVLARRLDEIGTTGEG